MEESLSVEELTVLFEERIRLFSTLTDEERLEIIQAAGRWVERLMPVSFVLSGARSMTQRIAANAENREQPPDEVRRHFIEGNELPPEQRIPASLLPRREAKAREREAYADRIRDLLRETRSAKHRHERRKLRRLLMGIDPVRLHRVLGAEGETLAREIRLLLLDLNDVR